MTNDKKPVYTEDLGFDLYSLDAPALFTPSVSRNYVGYTSSYAEKMPGWRAPKGISKEGTELNFLDPDNGSWFYPAALTSAGHANLNIDGSTTLDIREGMFRNRNRDRTVIIGDSGGYQIGTGVLKFDWKNFESAENNDLRLKILRWMESIADISMTLDVPVWGIDAGLEGITSFDECLKKTLWNHDFFIKNRVPGATRLMNILHGRSASERDTWWNAVKDLPFEGWAFAGSNISNFETILHRLIIMRDGGYLDEARNWIHFLGVSKLSSACAFSAIQRTIRKHVEPKFTISFDASSPFLSTAKGRMYTRLNYGPTKMNYTMDQAIDNKLLAGSQEPFPFMSPIGKKLILGDICVKGNGTERLVSHLEATGFPSEEANNIAKRVSSGEFTKEDNKDLVAALTECAANEENIFWVTKSIADIQAKSSWDSWSYMFIMNHNCYMHARGVKEVGHLYNLPRPHVKEFIPEELLEFKDLVEEVFTSSKPMELIKSHSKLLKNLSGSRNNDKKLDAFKTSGLFELDVTDASLDIEDSDEHYFDDDIIDNLE